jgi:hypothetical protein
MHTYKFDCGICLKVEQANGSTIKTLQTDWKVFTDELHIATWIASNGMPGLRGVGDQINQSRKF